MRKRRTALVALVLLAPWTGLGQFREPERIQSVHSFSGFRNNGGLQPEKSVLLAIGLSLVLPGMGEMYAGNFEAGRYFLAADAALWLTYGGFVLHGDWVRNDARTFAVQHAGADFRGKDETFDVDVGNFASVAEYNQVRLRNREYDRLYESQEFSWIWDSEENRIRFRRLRIRSDELYQSSRFIIGVLVVNRVISAFSAARSASRHNKSLIDGWRLRANLDGGPFRANGIEMVVTKEF